MGHQQRLHQAHRPGTISRHPAPPPTPNPKPQTLNPKPQTLNPRKSHRNTDARLSQELAGDLWLHRRRPGIDSWTAQPLNCRPWDLSGLWQFMALSCRVSRFRFRLGALGAFGFEVRLSGLGRTRKSRGDATDPLKPKP